MQNKIVYNIEQSLSDTEKKQARDNIGAVGQGELAGIFMGVYTGSASTNTSFNAYQEAWQRGCMLFLRYYALGGDVVMPLDTIDSGKIVFVRPPCSVGSAQTFLQSTSVEVLPDNSYTFGTVNVAVYNP